MYLRQIESNQYYDVLNMMQWCTRGRVHEETAKGTFQESREGKKEAVKEDITKDVKISFQNKSDANKRLVDLVKEDTDGDMYIVNTDNELTDIIKKTFETHGCEVSVTQLEKNLIALFILLNKKISIKKLKTLLEKGKIFALEFWVWSAPLTKD